MSLLICVSMSEISSLPPDEFRPIGLDGLNEVGLEFLDTVSCA